MTPMMMFAQIAFAVQVLGPFSPAIQQDEHDAESKKPLLEQVFKSLTGTNGYEEYVQAADNLRVGLFDDYQAYARYIAQPARRRLDPEAVAPKPPPGVTEKSTVLDVYRAATRRFRAALDLMAKGNLKPVAPPLDGTFSTMYFPELGPLKNLARLSSYAAHVSLAEGRPSEATDRLLTAWTFSSNISDGLLFHYLVAQACKGIILRQFANGLGKFSLADWRRIDSFCAGDLKSDNLRRPLEHELEAIARSLADTKELDTMMDELKGSFENEEMSKEDTAFLKDVESMTDAQRDSIRSRIIQLLNDQFQKADTILGSDERLWQKKFAELEMEVPSTEIGLVEKLAWRFAEIFSPMTSGVPQNALRTRAIVRVLRLHARVQIAYLTNGSLPNSLASITSADERANPFGKGEFKYVVHNPGTYEIYGEGNDLYPKLDLWARRKASDVTYDEDEEGPKKP